MNAQSRLVRFFVTPLFFWLALFVVGSYFMLSIDKSVLREEQKNATTFFDHVRCYWKSWRLEHVGKGIDLAGGTYLVLGVELEKALDSRLRAENKSLDQLFESKQLRTMPTKKEVKGTAIDMVFDEEEVAKSCFNIIQEHQADVLKVSRSGKIVQAILSPEIETSIRKGAVEQAVSVLNNRLGSYGVEGITVQPHGERQIIIQLPGVNDPDRVKAVVTKTAHLEFKLVEDVARTKEKLLDKFDGELPSDKIIIPGTKEEAGSYYLVSAYPDLTGDHIIDARVAFDEFHRPEVDFRLDSSGAKDFAELTANNVGRRLGIIIDNVMYSSPSIKSEIAGGRAQISNIQSQKEALDLSIVLKSGSLKAPLKFEQESRVGASLGRDSINKGMLSCWVAILLLCVFSLFYYRIPGVFAIIALFYNIFLILLFLSYFGATLNLPGIAGMVVTIGMAIDASILIYERIKDFIEEGETFKMAITKGFQGATSVILDSNITTFLTGLILFQFGGPGVKGFAVTLMAGIVATVLAGVYFLKSIFFFATDVIGLKKSVMLKTTTK
ncbi:MAG: protein translocase subunit SecD [bacterium]